MAHEIESMFYLGETPWHGLGKRVVEAPSVEEAIKQAGLDWRVLERPIYLGPDAPADNATPSDAVTLDKAWYENPAQREGLQITSHKALLRATDGALLGVVGNRYQPLQNSEAFNFFNPFVEQGLVDLETAGSLRDGKRIWILARIKGDSDISIVGDDVVRKFILLSNSHDGTLAVRVGFTPVRVVCANTLAIAHHDGESSLIRLRHSRSLLQNLDALRDTINLANQSFEATAEQYRALAQRQINAADLHKYVKIVLGHEKTEDKDLSTRAENQIAEVVSLFESGRGNNLPGVRGTVWAAYNAVTEYLTHEAGKDAQKRYDSLWFGGNAQRNETALNEALKLLAA